MVTPSGQIGAPSHISLDDTTWAWLSGHRPPAPDDAEATGREGSDVFANSILDVVIGLVFVFFVCSLAVSGINEFVRKLLNTRAKALWTAISRMLDPSEAAAQSERITPRLEDAPTREQPGADPDGARGASLAELLYDHPLIGRLDPTRLNRPTRITHIAPTEFARALVDVLTPEDGDGNKRWDQLGDELRSLPRPLRAQLLVLYEESGDDVKAFRQAIEGWFTSSMDRVSDWYRRRTRLVMFGYGLLVAVAFNVSAVHVTAELYENDVVRETVVELAAVQTAQDNLQDCVDRTCVKEEIGKVVDTGLPVLWRTCPDGNGDSGLCGFEDGRATAGTIVGWLITAAALSVGAAFWFALLKRAFQVRSKVGTS